VRERLWEVAELLTREPDLLCVQADVVRIGEHLLEGEAGLLEPARPPGLTDTAGSCGRNDAREGTSSSTAISGRTPALVG
jgi:hypothetical protein